MVVLDSVAYDIKSLLTSVYIEYINHENISLDERQVETQGSTFLCEEVVGCREKTWCCSCRHHRWMGDHRRCSIPLVVRGAGQPCSSGVLWWSSCGLDVVSSLVGSADGLGFMGAVER
jgi:hypothetical protein